jgi:Predicted oxidoreductases (related to aryl-alcohol dehydrogenases)
VQFIKSFIVLICLSVKRISESVAFVIKERMETMMQNRKFGKSDLVVSPISFGGNIFGWTVNEQESFDILDAWIGAGFNFIDTADMYSIWVPGNVGGESETIIGNWMKSRGNRDKIVIATKLGIDMGEGRCGLSARYMKQAVEDSLMRLQTDYIDLYLSHADDPDTSVEETMTAFHELIKEGKVRYVGASNICASRVEASNKFARENGLSPYISLQPLYNLYDRACFEKEYLSLVKEEDLAVQCYYSLASGFLTGKYRCMGDLTKSQRGEGIRQYMNERGYAILKAQDKLAKEKQSTPAQIAIAWLLHKDYVTTPIASATNGTQLADLFAAVSLMLSDAEMDYLDSASNY